MSSGELLIAGIELMFLGMGIVFVFLAILIGTLKLMSSLASRLPVEQPTGNASTPAAVRPGSSGTGPELIAVMSAAVARFRAIHQ